MKKITSVFDINKGSQLSTREMNYDATPRVSNYGLCELINFKENDSESKKVGFYTMPLYEMDLKQYLSQFKGLKKVEKILDVVHKLASIFKYVHCSKRTYNDLKLQNVMINTMGSPDADPEVFLIDFGFAAKFVCKDGKEHIPRSKQVDVFAGNMIFASER